MKLHKFNSKIIKLMVVISLITFIGLLINWSLRNVNDAVIDATVSEMSQIGNHAEQALENNLAETKDDLVYLADYIVKLDVPAEDIGDFLATQAQTERFDTLYYIDIDGNGVSLNGETQDFSENETFLCAMQNDFFIDEPYISSVTNELIFDISVPVVKHGEVIAVLYTETSMREFWDSMADTIAATGDIFIVDYNLNLIFSTSENHTGTSLVPQEDVAEMGIENVAKAQADFSERRSGGFYYDYYGTPKVMVYFPIENTEWTLAMNAEVAAINSILTNAVERTDTISAIIYWTVIFLVIYISVVQMRSDKKLIKTAYYDPLTQLANTTKLKLDITTTLEQNKRKLYSIIVFDIENFKAINEKFGYEIGDRVLKTIKSFSDSFNEPSLVTARIGGDRFAMFAEKHFLEDISILTENVSNHFDTCIPELRDYSGTYKIGRYHIEFKETDFDDIMAKVNLALVRAKSSKSEVLCDYDDTLKKKVLNDAEITNKMRTALGNQEFKVYLQPKFSTYGNELVSAEALVRWTEANGKMIYPNDFIPLFERNGFIVELDKYMLENVCQTLNRWQSEGFEPISVSVNCSRLNLENPFFVDGIVAIVDKYHVPHECIEIELTESATIENETTIEKLFADLRKNNFKISIDDFGAGYSSLGMLKNLHVDTLKMDRSFFVGGKSERRDDVLVDSIVKMSHNLGMYVVAEGIETKEQVELLRSMNCDAIQGYVYARPMPIDEFEKEYRDVLLHKSTKQKTFPLIQNINDAKFANSLVPCGILISKLDEWFTMTEANKSYFDIVGFTREEIRDIYGNRGLDMIDPQDKIAITQYFNKQMKLSPDEPMEYVCKTITKGGKYKTVQLRGVVATNEIGQARLYFSVTDITDYAEMTSKIKHDKAFVSNIASLMNNAYFDFDNTTQTIRFSKNFSSKFHIPETIENFLDSNIRASIFPAHQASSDGKGALVPTVDGQFCMILPNGDPVWYLYHYEFINDENGKVYRTVGKLTEMVRNKLVTDISRVKSEIDLLTGLYNQQTTQKYIHSYLQVAPHSNSTGALFAIRLNHFSKFNDTFGCEFSGECLAELGKLLLDAFSDMDIVGRMGTDQFLVLIGNYKTIDELKAKGTELCAKLNKTYEKDGKNITLTANIGIALYPDHGKEFDSLYKKATTALNQAEKDLYGGFSIY